MGREGKEEEAGLGHPLGGGDTAWSTVHLCQFLLLGLLFR
jgi:hypothetical protein